MQIGTLKLKNDIILAPLAGITNLPFRLLAKAAGCGLVYSEMVSANGLVHRSPKTMNMLVSDPMEKPLSIQFFGSDPEVMAEAAVMVAESGADVVDINLGCSVKKVVKTGAGAGPDAQTCSGRGRHKGGAQSRPYSADNKNQKRVDGFRRAGNRNRSTWPRPAVSMRSPVHPRTAGQGFRGTANWHVIEQVKDRLGIPVIGNGDIRTAGRCCQDEGSNRL